MIKIAKFLTASKYVVYHGSQNEFKTFDYKFIGKGSGTTGLGRGFYFTNDKDDAIQYSEGKFIYTFEITINKPVLTDRRKITKIQIQKLISMHPDLPDALSDWGDVKYEGLNKVLNIAVSNYNDEENDLELINGIGNDIYKNDWKLFFQNLKKIGYDGVVQNKNDGVVHYVIFNPNQAKIIKTEKV